jgi:hypothetical protein
MPRRNFKPSQELTQLFAKPTRAIEPSPFPLEDTLPEADPMPQPMPQPKHNQQAIDPWMSSKERKKLARRERIANERRYLENLASKCDCLCSCTDECDENCDFVCTCQDPDYEPPAHWYPNAIEDEDYYNDLWDDPEESLPQFNIDDCSDTDTPEPLIESQAARQAAHQAARTFKSTVPQFTDEQLETARTSIDASFTLERRQGYLPDPEIATARQQVQEVIRAEKQYRNFIRHCEYYANLYDTKPPCMIPRN